MICVIHARYRVTTDYCWWGWPISASCIHNAHPSPPKLELRAARNHGVENHPVGPHVNGGHFVEQVQALQQERQKRRWKGDKLGDEMMRRAVDMQFHTKLEILNSGGNFNFLVSHTANYFFEVIRIHPWVVYQACFWSFVSSICLCFNSFCFVFFFAASRLWDWACLVATGGVIKHKWDPNDMAYALQGMCLVRYVPDC